MLCVVVELDLQWMWAARGMQISGMRDQCELEMGQIVFSGLILLPVSAIICLLLTKK